MCGVLLRHAGALVAHGYLHLSPNTCSADRDVARRPAVPCCVVDQVNKDAGQCVGIGLRDGATLVDASENKMTLRPCFSVTFDECGEECGEIHCLHVQTESRLHLIQ